MKRLQWIAASLTRTLGLPGLAGCALLMLAALLFVVQLRPLQQQVANRLAAKRAMQAAGAGSSSTIPVAPWDASLPARAELNRQLLEVRELADQSGLYVRATDYNLTKVDGTSLWRYQMVLPLDSNYVTVQRFIGRTLHALPNLALNGVEIQRSDQGEGLVTATLRFSLYFRQE